MMPFSPSDPASSETGTPPSTPIHRCTSLIGSQPLCLATTSGIRTILSANKTNSTWVTKSCFILCTHQVPRLDHKITIVIFVILNSKAVEMRICLYWLKPLRYALGRSFNWKSRWHTQFQMHLGIKNRCRPKNLREKVVFPCHERIEKLQISGANSLMEFDSFEKYQISLSRYAYLSLNNILPGQFYIIYNFPLMVW